jgi:Protein of unknown function (DUF1214)
VTDHPGAAKTLEAWTFLRTMIDNLTNVILEDAETDAEVLDGLRVLARITALCEELSLDADPAAPRFFAMNTPVRYVGGPNPDGEYHLGMIDGRRRYRIRGNRGTVTYLGFQVLAGTGLTPRRQAVYVGDRTMTFGADGSYELVLSTMEPSAAELGEAEWVQIPEDASAVVTRQYVADRSSERLATYTIETLDPAGEPPLPDDEVIAGQLTAMAWTIAKLMTLHRTIMPHLVQQPNELMTAEAAAIGSADTTPDNLYMIGTYRLAPGEALVIDAVPPDTRYWSLTAESIWHECVDVARRRISITNAHAERRPNGWARLVVAHRDPGVANWIDTAHRHRGWLIFRWLDNPSPPDVKTRVVPLADVAALD